MTVTEDDNNKRERKKSIVRRPCNDRCVSIDNRFFLFSIKSRARGYPRIMNIEWLSFLRTARPRERERGSRNQRFPPFFDQQKKKEKIQANRLVRSTTP